MRSRTSVIAAVAGALVVLSGCSSDGDEPAGLDATDDASPTEEVEQADDGEEAGAAEDEAMLEELFADFWDAVVAAENGPEVDYELFEGIATDEVIEERLARAREWEELGVHREGEPIIENVTVTVEGDEARIEACRDESEWLVIADGEPVDIETTGLTPNVFTAERDGDGWLINGRLDSSEATITCE
ncbi:hypothetical protein EF847_04705 [Actinobacteria bacterium YIM 96077]|uniref:Nuclear transport factor 2 family protein n=1 Tax=Phytoactinopolyspora halophila TaxID=1981511 RepID=A0A329R2R5_9ACTN|nr:hypothetical protein [Phytoactinopolyspora halophila]AYY12112.1 hypothetical protein EF847_04705 [Actinobacteria bacterium YIM 96077]RAW18653.1 hypothetical protein DPM12_00810 [Phytoactinopolyspora halophila]